MDKEYNDLIGDILKDSNYDKNFSGKGKPLSKEYLNRDVFQNFQQVARDAGYLPPWLTLQKKISKLVHNAKTTKDIEIINEKIKEYNKICPNSMQRYPIRLEDLKKAKKIW